MRRGRFLILLGLILALGTAAVVFLLLKSATTQPTPTEVIPKEDVVVVMQPIAKDEPVEGRVDVQAMPKTVIPTGAIRSLAETSGVIAAVDLDQGTILQRSMVLTPEERRREGELGKLVQPGYVAVAFPIDELSSVSYGIQPGDHVDILMTFPFIDIDQERQIKEPVCPIICPGLPSEEGELITIGPEGQRPRLVAQLTLQDVEVLGVGRWPTQEVPAAEEQEKTQTSKQTTPTTPELPAYITLMLTPQDALVLKLAREYKASIDLAVRAQDDHQQFTTSQVTLDYILARFAVTLPPKQPYTIEELKGARPQGPE